MATNQETQTLEETLNKTDLGHVINENKKAVGIASLIIILTIIGYVVFSQVQDNQQKELLAKAYQLNESLFLKFSEGKLTADEFKTQLKSVSNELYTLGNLYPGLLGGLKKLQQENALDQATMDQANVWLETLDKRGNLYLISGLAMASIWEDFGNPEKALSLYSELSKRPDDLMKDQIFFHMGRLTLEAGDKAMGEKYFQYIFDEFADTQYAKLAKIYLAGI